VTWQGSDINGALSKAGGDKPDVICYCYDYYLTIETTQKTGANQWSQEFAQCVRHCDNFVRQNSIDTKDVYGILVTPTLHEDTYRSLHSHPSQKYKLVPLEVRVLSEILETSILAFTMKHLEMRLVLNRIRECLNRSSSLANFQQTLEGELNAWQKKVLEIEKNAVVGVRSYEAMRKIDRKHISTGEILQKLERNPTLLKYLKLIENKISLNMIEDSVIQHSLAYRLTSTYEDERLLGPVPFVDFKERKLRLIKAVEEVG
jgi:hypothetical protein